jgi:hypothetical protein
VLLVAHARILRATLATGVEEGKRPGAGFLNPVWIKNAEILDCHFADNQIKLV